MADLPEPVDITASVSRPASTASIASRWPGRSAAKPNASRATRSIRSSVRATVAGGLPQPASPRTASRPPGAPGRRRRRGGRRPLGVELPGGDRGAHVLGLLAVDRAVLELDHGVLALAAETFEVVALAGPQRALDELILDPG